MTAGRALLALAVVLAAPPALAKPNKPAAGFEPALPAAPAPSRSDGGIFDPDGGYAPLVGGSRAARVGDPLTILLLEATTATKSIDGSTGRNGGASLTPPTAGLLGFLNPDALKASSQSSFKGQGDASQTSRLTGAVAVTIAEVRPNGTAVVRGEKRMLFSQGREWIQFAGIVRLSDIDADNRIASTRVADAHIEYTGKGALQRSSRPGWLSRLFGAISPF
ncbi:MAG: flagellar basal body L-ring protein FlgH [Novosphingobium sp.]